MISRHGFIKCRKLFLLKVYIDKEKNIESKLFDDSFTSSIRQVKRQHQTVINYLAKKIVENQRD